MNGPIAYLDKRTHRLLRHSKETVRALIIHRPLGTRKKSQADSAVRTSTVLVKSGAETYP